MVTESTYDYMNILQVSEDTEAIYVEGDTFRYGFSKKTGLMSKLKIMGNDFLEGTNSGIPDIYVSDNEFPDEALYAARYETEAECEILSASSHEIHIRTHGLFRGHNGMAFHIRFRITYEIAGDGTIFVIVDSKATDICMPRWLCVSAGTLNLQLCRYYSHLAEQNGVKTTRNYAFGSIDERDEILFDGQLIPWFWFGNDRTGVDFAVWGVGHQRVGTTIVTEQISEQYPQIDVHTSAKVQENGVSWEILSIENNAIKVNPGWEYTSYFSLSVKPSKPYNADFSGLLTLSVSSQDFDLPDEQIELIASKGVNLVITDINRPGVYDVGDENKLRHIIEKCHDLGVKIIPHLSLMEMNKNLPVFNNQSTEWLIEPSLEDDREIALMCPSADGWREYWKEKIDAIIDEYEFDGLYIDINYDRLVCGNPLHGCQRKHIRPSFLWVREMLMHAWLKMKSKSRNSVLIAKTGKMAISMINNWVDVRCIGNQSDLICADKLERKAFYSTSYLGSNNPLCIEQDELDTNSELLSLIHWSAPIISYDQIHSDRIDEFLSYWQVYKFFGANSATLYSNFLDDENIVKSDCPDLYVNIHKHDNVLLTAVNLSDKVIDTNIHLAVPEELDLSDSMKYMIYDPIAEEIYNGLHNASLVELTKIPIKISGQNAQFIFIREVPKNPLLIFIMGVGELVKQYWDEAKRLLKVVLSAQKGFQATISIYFPYGEPERMMANGRELSFTWEDKHKLAIASVIFDDMINDVEIHASI